MELSGFAVFLRDNFMQKNFTSQIDSFDVKFLENMFSGRVILGAGPLFSDFVVLACLQRKKSRHKISIICINSAYKKDTSHRSGGFRGRPIQRRHQNLRHSNPCCHGDGNLEILT